MYETIMIDSIVSFLVNQIGNNFFTNVKDRAYFDLVYLDDKKQKTAIEIKTSKVNKQILQKIAINIQKNPDIKNFILITPNEPSKEQVYLFKEIIGSLKRHSVWYSINTYFKQYNIDVNDNNDLNYLQIAGITSQLNKYSNEHIGKEVDKNYLDQYKKNYEETKNGEHTLNPIILMLRRQFSDSMISNFPENIKDLKNYLFIGEKFYKAIILLSDIKNFSTIVSASDPEELRDMMTKYYMQAKRIVFKYNGVLDKFIGDSVLAIFNFPNKKEESIIKALKCASELIIMGKELLNEMQDNMDNSIDTGTRIGMTIGPIYPLSLSDEYIEISFIGDKINLAARLESRSEVNGILISNKVYKEIKENISQIKDDISFKKVIFEREEMKGQITNITAWQIYESQLDKIILSE